MSIRFSCSCGRKLKVSDEKIGMKVLCSSCGATLKVPKKSQDAYWQDVEPQTQEAKVDYIGGIKEFLIQVVPGLLVVGALIWGTYYASSMMITGSSDRPPLAEVTGTVTLNGQPLENATVKFIPVVEKGTHIAPSQALTNAKGYYRLFYVRDVPGAAVGEHRVEITIKDPRGRERLPDHYHRKSTLRHAVKDGSQTIDFPLETPEEKPAAATQQDF